MRYIKSIVVVIFIIFVSLMIKDSIFKKSIKIDSEVKSSNLNSQIFEEQGSVNIYYNGNLSKELNNSFIYQGVTFVQARSIADIFDISLSWNANDRTIMFEKDNKIIKYKIDSNIVEINNKIDYIKYPALLVDSKAFIPIYSLCNYLDYDIRWNSEKKVVEVKTKNTILKNDTNIKEFNFNGLEIGDSLSKLNEKLGEQDRIDKNEYGFLWYTYENSNIGYIQVGIYKDKIVGFYLNSKLWQTSSGIKDGSEKYSVKDKYGDNVKYIDKKNIRYNLNEKDEYEIFDYEGCYVTIFYDLFENSTVNSILVIEKSMESLNESYFGEQSDEIALNAEKELTKIVNAERSKRYLEKLTLYEELSNSALGHTMDMISKGYFEHDNIDGLTPFDRMSNEGIKFYSAAENIAAGQRGAIYIHEALMNSEGHRVNILGDYKNIGIGIRYGGKYGLYCTQNFCTLEN